MYVMECREEMVALMRLPVCKCAERLDLNVFTPLARARIFPYSLVKSTTISSLLRRDFFFNTNPSIRSAWNMMLFYMRIYLKWPVKFFLTMYLHGEFLIFYSRLLLYIERVIVFCYGTGQCVFDGYCGNSFRVYGHKSFVHRFTKLVIGECFGF